MTTDEDYTKPALTLIRKALKGNGVRVDTVTIKSFEGAVLNFMAATHVTLSHQIIESTVPGSAAGGDVFQNRPAARQEAEAYVSTPLQKPAMVAQIKDLVSKQPHQGFGLNDETIKLSFLDRDFISQEACSACHGNRQIQCAKCSGKGFEPCPHCNAEGFERCDECHGNRQVRGPQGQMETCHLCQGLGKTSCSFCREHRKIQCGICRSTGEIPCKPCSGHGSQSNILSAKIAAECTFDFDAAPLTEQAAAMVIKLGPDLADQAKVTPVTAERENVEQDVLHLLYEVSVPQGNVEFSIKDQVVPAYIFGVEGGIKDIPYFLDAIIAPGINKLAQAASGQGAVGENIRAGIKYKTIRQAVTAAARYNSKKAMNALLHYTPLGLSAQVARKLIEDSNTALNNATKQQRMMAVAFGIGSGVVLSALYFFSPLRSSLLAFVGNATLHMPVNILALGLCAAVGYGVWQTMASRAKKQALQNFMASK